MEYNNNSLKVSEWSTEKLKEEGQALWQSIYIVDCFGVKDMILLNMIEKELYHRGYKFQETTQLEIIKGK